MTQSPSRQVEVITADAALALVSAALREGARIGLPVSAAVVDPSMALIAFARADGATPHGVESSRRKANTSASMGKATGWMTQEIALGLALAADNLVTNLPGGVPIRFDGRLIGALGVAGGRVEQDAAVAHAALKAIGADAVG